MEYFVLVMFAALVTVSAQKYTTKFDGVNLDNVLQNDRLLSNYINCVLERGKCTVDGLELKKHIPEALEEGCARCSEKQRQGAEKTLRFLYENKPELFQELEEMFNEYLLSVEHIPEALEEGCARCSEKQRQGAEKVLRFLYENKPDLFQELEAKFDPEGKYRAKYRERADKLGVKV